MRPTSWDRSRWIALPRWLTSPAPRPAGDLVGRVNSSLDALRRLVGLNGLIDIAGDIVRGASSISGPSIHPSSARAETLALQLQGLYQQLTQPSSARNRRSRTYARNTDPMTRRLGRLPSAQRPAPGATSARREVNTAAMREFTRAGDCDPGTHSDRRH